MHPLIQQHIPELKRLCRQYQVESLALFGSAATGNFSAESDIDFLVRFSDAVPVLDYAENYFALLDQLKKLLHREVDLVSEKSIKNPVLLEEIGKTKVPLV